MLHAVSGTTLITPAILEDYVDDLTLPYDQTILSEPIELTIDAKESSESGNKSDLDQNMFENNCANV